MSDERRDDETGRALGRAIESQSVRETPYAASRLARRLERPAGRGWTYALPIAAALALFVAMGWFFAGRGPQGVATPSQTSPTPTATTAGVGSPAPTSGPALQQFVVWFSRDQLPPVPGTASAPGPSATQTSDRISARVRALWDASPSAAGSYNEFRTRPGISLKNVTTTVTGDLATVVVDAGGWSGLSSAETIAVVGQLVYTITEEPGIRRAALREPGKDHAEIGSGILKDPMTREDVNGYGATIDERIVAEDETVASNATAIVSNDTVAPGLGRVAIELRASQAPTGGFWSPRFTAELQRNDDAAAPGKWVLRITIPGATAAGVTLTPNVPGAPINRVGATTLVGSAGENATTHAIYLTDARPWRVSVEPGSSAGTIRVLVDIGGHPQAIAQGTVVYSPRQNADVARQITVTGAARAFEATVSWRVRDSGGRDVARGFTTASMGTGPVWGTFSFVAQVPANVSGNIQLEVYQASPRDGSDTNKVEVRLQVR